jgi:hypothetical protein
LIRRQPLANRVAPDGALFSTPERGLFLGNRGGRFHDPDTKTVRGRPFAARQWLCCVTQFKGRTRDHMGGVWGRGYTELFFCDEVTALAAGHRPCVECRRLEAMAYRASIVVGLLLSAPPRFPQIDVMLDGERRIGNSKRLHQFDATMLPDGAMYVLENGRFAAVKQDSALLWSSSGYTQRISRPEGMINVLTPPTTLAALIHGYAPTWHASVEKLINLEF